MRNAWAGALLALLLVAGCDRDTNNNNNEKPPSQSGQSMSREELREIARSAEAEAEEIAASVPPIVADKRAPIGAGLRQLAQEFVTYAVGKSDSFPHANSVEMSLGGETVLWIDDIEAALSRREIWKICPEDWDTYSAASCPVDLLSPITDAALNGEPLVYSGDYGEVQCAPDREGPPSQGHRVVLRPLPESKSCAQDFAIVLTADQQGRLEKIDLTLSNP